MKLKICVAAVLSALCFHTHAASVEAFANATVQPGGVRTPPNGLAFFNIEGSANGSFASYGVARFDTAAIRSALDASFGSGLWVIDTIHVELTQSNAGFTTDGPVSVYFTADDATSIEIPSTLIYPFGGAHFPDAVAVTSYTFTQISDGTLESHLLWARGGSNSAGGDALRADLLSDGVLTLALVEGSSSVAATYAGYTHDAFAGPTLVVVAQPVPEPETVALMLAGLGLVAFASRRRARGER